MASFFEEPFKINEKFHANMLKRWEVNKEQGEKDKCEFQENGKTKEQGQDGGVHREEDHVQSTADASQSKSPTATNMQSPRATNMQSPTATNKQSSTATNKQSPTATDKQYPTATLAKPKNKRPFFGIAAAPLNRFSCSWSQNVC